VLKACWWCESVKALAVREGCRQQGFLHRQAAERGALEVPGEIRPPLSLCGRRRGREWELPIGVALPQVSRLCL
jgi:hypothetical protein